VLRTLLWVVSGLLVLLLLAVAVLSWRMRREYEPALARFQKEVTQHVGYFCEQQVALSADPWFHEPRRQGDAGPLLNTWVAWEPKNARPRGSPLTVPSHLPQKSVDFKDWLSSTADVSTLDFEWMRKLHAYDRWELSNGIAPGATGQLDWAQASLPYFVDLQLWTKFRLLHGLRTGTPLEAARDVRQLAWLAFRTDTLIGAAVANALLRMERAAYESMKQPPAAWKPMSSEQLERMRAVIMTGHAFSNIAAPAGVAKQARRCGEPALSRCSALTESAAMAKLVLPVALSEYPEQYAALTEDLEALSCPTSLPRTVWERGVTVEEAAHTGSGLPGQAVRLKGLPRALFGPHLAGILMALGTPSLQPLYDFQAAHPPASSTARP
jgi:hypothetical protein